MPVLKTYILDDDPRAVKRLRKLVDGREDLILVGTSTHPEKALADIAKYKPELLLLDLEMDPLTGWQVMERLDPAIRVIITTVDREQGMKAWHSRAAYYLIKPFKKSDFDKAIDFVWEGIATGDVRPLPEGNGELWLTAGGKKQPVCLYLADIEAIKADGNDSYVFYTYGVMQVDQSLSEIEKRLPVRQFMRIHRGHIIALNRYLSHNSNEVILQHVENKEVKKLSIGEQYAKRFYAHLYERSQPK